MGPEITGLAGLFSRDFLVGYVFPSLLFLVTCLFLGAASPAALSNHWLEEPPWGLFVLVFILAAFVGLLLYMANLTVTRLFEGTPDFPLSLLFLLAGGWHRHRFLRQRKKIELEKSDERKDELELELFENFPPEESEVLPTRLGNIIRSFEIYPHHRYGMDAVILWPRLLPVLPDKQLSRLGEALSNFNFYLNCSFLTLLLLPWLFIVQRQYSLRYAFMSFVASILVVSYLLYRVACLKAYWWGELVRSSFDLYRLDLLRKLRFAVQPEMSIEEERNIWPQVYWSMKYLHDPTLRLRPKG